MHAPEALLDIHARSHGCLASSLRHCRELTAEELDREIPGFGYATVRLQFHHAIGAERYWLGVLEGRIDADDDAESYPTVAALETLREQVFARTAAHLRSVAADDLDRPRTMTIFGGRTQMLGPAQVILRTQTHLFHHLGQIAAMCRILGKPTTGSDYPIT